MNNLNKKYEILRNYQNLFKHSLLKGEELNKLIVKLKTLKIPKDTDEVLKRKIQKLQSGINTVRSNIDGYAISGGIIDEWLNLLGELIKHNSMEKQTYYKFGSDDKIIQKVKELVLSANEIICIIDPYIDLVILDILRYSNTKAIKVITKESKETQNIINKFDTFNNLFQEIKIEYKFSNSFHDRFYIIDQKVFTIGKSLQKTKKGTMFNPIEDEIGKQIITDFNIDREDTNQSSPL